MMVVLDTSALIHWTLNPSQLSAPAQAAIKRSSHIVISSISIWEIGIKLKKKKLHLPVSLEGYVRDLQRVRYVELAPVDTATWLANLSLKWAHRDPADRTIVATAQRRKAPLVTSDKTIRDFYSKAIW